MSFKHHAFKVVLLLLVSVSPCFANDAQNGAALAERWCASCHVISSKQNLASGFAPSFASIARRSTLDAASLAQSLAVPHPQMPDRALSQKEAADLAAYLRSLK